MINTKVSPNKLFNSDMKMARKSEPKMTIKTLQLECETLKRQMLDMNGMVQKIQKLEEEHRHEVNDLKKRIMQLETVLKESEGNIDKRKKQQKTRKKQVRLESCEPEKSFSLLNCNLCGKGFGKHFDLETHIKKSHERHTEFKCDKCSKTFVLKWRLNKHMEIHSDRNIKQCMYYINMKTCPFEELGCKFLHVQLSRYSQTIERQKHADISNVSENEESENEDSFDEEMLNDMNHDDKFLTSTPKKTKFECEECENKSQCTDCFVGQTLASSCD